MTAIQSYGNLFGTMARSFRISKGGPTILQGAVDPNASPVVAGNAGDLYIETGTTPNFYLNVGSSTWRSLLVTVGQPFTRTVVATASYTALSTDLYIGVNYAGAVTIYLPAGVANKQFTFKDESGLAQTNPITIVPDAAGPDTIDGQSTFVLNTPYEAVNMVFGGEWHVY